MKIFFLSVLILSGFLQLSYADYDSFTVNVPNDQGGYTTLIIKKSGDGYAGPQGEYYPHFPSVAQLQAVYRVNPPRPTVVTTTTYVEPPVQEAVNPQVVYQQPEDQEEVDADIDAENYPVNRPNIITEISPPVSLAEEDNQWVYFRSKKKEKSKKHEEEHPNTTKSVAAVAANKSQVKTKNEAPVQENKKDDPKAKDHKDHDGQQNKPSVSS